jgi:hypothetical protein
MMSLYCTASMLPCGRYYYDPEGGYVGNPWVKISYQFVYLYLGWIIHHLDLFDHYIFQFTQTLVRRCSDRINQDDELFNLDIDKRIDKRFWLKDYLHIHLQGRNNIFHKVTY